MIESNLSFPVLVSNIYQIIARVKISKKNFAGWNCI